MIFSGIFSGLIAGQFAGVTGAERHAHVTLRNGAAVGALEIRRANDSTSVESGDRREECDEGQVRTEEEELNN